MSRSAPASTIGWVPARAMAMGLAARAMGVMRSLKSIRKVVFAPFRAGSIAKNERNETLGPRRKSADATAKLLARNSTKARQKSRKNPAQISTRTRFLTRWANLTVLLPALFGLRG